MTYFLQFKVGTTYIKLNAKDKTDEDGFSPAKGKRKVRSPLSGERGKRTRTFSPSKAGHSIYNMIRNRGLVDTVNIETSGSESEDTDDDEETPIAGADVDAKPNDEGKPENKTTSKTDEDPKFQESVSMAVEDESVSGPSSVQ